MRFENDGVSAKKRNGLIEMPLQHSLNNIQYKLFAFVVHISQQTSEGHYIAYVNHNGTWNECNDERIRTNVDITGIKDKGYYYCYSAVVNN